MKLILSTSLLVSTIGAAALAASAFAESEAAYQPTLDSCIAAWGKISPFKQGTRAGKTITAGVKVFGIGKNDVGDSVTTEAPELVLVRPAVNVLGKSTIHLGNPNGWYCFKANVSVLGKMAIEADCRAHIASASEGGTSVLASDDSNSSVAVLGSVRVNRYGCPGTAPVKEKAAKKTEPVTPGTVIGQPVSTATKAD